jgi:hypothetical protein
MVLDYGLIPVEPRARMGALPVGRAQAHSTLTIYLLFSISYAEVPGIRPATPLLSELASLRSWLPRCFKEARCSASRYKIRRTV